MKPQPQLLLEMPHSKQALIAAFHEYAILMTLKGENSFRTRAYEYAIKIFEQLDGTPQSWLEEGILNNIHGIGEGIRQKVQEWVESGQIESLETLKNTIPPGLIELLKIPHLGPKKLAAIYEQLGVDSLEMLERIALSGELVRLPGFGAKSVANILTGIQLLRNYQKRYTLDQVIPEATEIHTLLKVHLSSTAASIALTGEIRRYCETCESIDFVVSADTQKSFVASLSDFYLGSEKFFSTDKAFFLSENGIPINLYFATPQTFSLVLAHTTGSNGHNNALREYAQRRGFLLNGNKLLHEISGAEIPINQEIDLYNILNLAWIPPELREGLDEIESAARGPADLVQKEDIRGLLHVHTTASDGIQSLEEWVEYCQNERYPYLAICDHSQTASYAHGLSPERLRQQCDEIDALNQKLFNLHIFKGVESDILENGGLDYDDALLARLDFVVASIHSQMSMDPKAMTQRLIRAIEHPATKVLGHPTGRILLKREPYTFDLDAVFEAAAQHNVAIEINTQPHRLDLDWRLIQRAKSFGCCFSLNVDAHAIEDINGLFIGAAIARKGCLAASDIINAQPLSAFEAWLHS